MGADDDVDVVDDGDIADHDNDHDVHRCYEGVGGGEGSVARRGDPRLEPLCRDLWKVFLDLHLHS